MVEFCGHRQRHAHGHTEIIQNFVPVVSYRRKNAPTDRGPFARRELHKGPKVFRLSVFRAFLFSFIWGCVLEEVTKKNGPSRYARIEFWKALEKASPTPRIQLQLHAATDPSKTHTLEKSHTRAHTYTHTHTHTPLERYSSGTHFFACLLHTTQHHTQHHRQQ